YSPNADQCWRDPSKVFNVLSWMMRSSSPWRDLSGDFSRREVICQQTQPYHLQPLWRGGTSFPPNSTRARPARIGARYGYLWQSHALLNTRVGHTPDTTDTR